MSKLSDFMTGGRPKSIERRVVSNIQNSVRTYDIGAVNPATSYLLPTGNLKVYISSSTQVTAPARASGSGDVTAPIIVVDGGSSIKSVQRGASDGTASIPIDAVNPAKCMLICSSNATATISANAITFRGALTAGTRWELVEYK